MKKSTIIIFLVLALLKTQAQDYLISFTGAGATTEVGTVKVDNLTSGTTVTLNGEDILHLFGSVGIGALNIDNENIRLYPNPMIDQSMLSFVAPEGGNADICIVDLSGKTFFQTSTMLSPGVHSFRVSGIKQGMYFVKVTGNNYFYSTKLISQSNLRGEAGIEYVSSEKNIPGAVLKSAAATIDMPYTTGDQLVFKGISGIYSAIVADVPVISKTITFNFAACTDADGNNYATVQIGTLKSGNQTWMAENLKVGVRIDGIQEQTNNGIIEKYCYYDDDNNCNVYGGLYQWNEMMQYVTTPGVKGICPTGWHIPTDGEWCTVTQFLDPTVSCGTVGLSGTNAGGKMKSPGTIEAGTGLWYDPNTGANNESGFTAVPAGHRFSNGTFYDVSAYGYWWGSSDNNTNIAWYRSLYCHYSDVFRGGELKGFGFSVRCVRDESIPFTCGSSMTINHIAGNVVPVNKTVTYGTVTNIPGEESKCWITSNLGADHQATAVNDSTEASAGWYWQFNRKQGYKHDGTTRTPDSEWIAPDENFDWQSAKDPCALELGAGWRIPTYSEWSNLRASGNWTDWNGPWNSDLKLHAAGGLNSSNGSLYDRGSYGYYWSSTQGGATYGQYLGFYSGICYLDWYLKANGFSARCLRD